MDVTTTTLAPTPNASHAAASAALTKASSPSLPFTIRLMTPSDIRDVIDLERDIDMVTFMDFDVAFAIPGLCGYVAELSSVIVGVLVYMEYKMNFDIHLVVVSPDARRHGIGKGLLKFVHDQMSHETRYRAVSFVSETNLAAQLFFRDAGYLAFSRPVVDVKTGKTAYRFERNLDLQ